MMFWLHNRSIRIKAFAAPIILLLCLAGLGLKSCTTLGEGAAGLVTLTESDLVKKKLVDDVTALAVVSQFKLFRYVSWLSNGIEEAVLQALEKEIVADSTAASDKLKSLMQRRDLSEQESGELDRPALETGSAAEQVLSAARLLLDEGNTLRSELQKFLATIRAD